jgi:DNA-binding response OmpR family regulator
MMQALHQVKHSSYKTILVVDDSQQLLDLYTYFFTKEGYEVISATNGLEAIEKFRMFKPHLVILDYEIPGIDGLLVAREILCKNVMSDQETEVFMVTGNDNVRSEAERIGVHSFLQKPISFRRILSEIILSAKQT